MSRQKNAPTSFRFSDEVKEMLTRLSDFRCGGNQTILVEMLIREAFRAEEEAIERAEKKKAGRQG